MTEELEATAATPRTNSDVTLASLAYINVTWEASHASYLDNFVPFVLEVLRTSPSAQEPSQIRDAVLTRFGLEFPTNVIKSLVDRGVRRDKITRVQRSSAVGLADGVADELPDLVSQQADFRRKQNSVVAALVAFAQDRFELDWTADAAEEALVGYIEQHVLPLLTSSVRGSRYADGDDPLQGRGYVVAAYVADVFENEPVTFGYLDEMIKGSMLASALYVESTGQVTRRFRKTTLYLDAPICLSLDPPMRIRGGCVVGQECPSVAGELDCLGTSSLCIGRASCRCNYLIGSRPRRWRLMIAISCRWRVWCR